MFNFFASFVVSFLGSIPLGSLNLTALQIYLRSHLLSVAYFSLAASIVEFFYSYFAIQGQIILEENPFLNRGFSFISILVLFTIGFINLRSKMKPISNSSIETNQGYFDQSNFSCFTKGLILSLLNPQAIPFWLVLSNFLQKQGLVEFKTNADTVYYILGVSLGTFVSLVSFAFLLGKFFHRKKIDTYLLNRFIGSILIGMAIYQLIGIGL